MFVLQPHLRFSDRCPSHDPTTYEEKREKLVKNKKIRKQENSAPTDAGLSRVDFDGKHGDEADG